MKRNNGNMAGRAAVRTAAIGEVLIKSFDKLKTNNGAVFFPSMVSSSTPLRTGLSRALRSPVGGDERNGLVRHFLRIRIPLTTLKGCVGLVAGFWLVAADAQPESLPLMLNDPRPERTPSNLAPLDLDADPYIPFAFRNPMPQPGASFGNHVAKVGDVNGDNIPDFLVGAPGQSVLGRQDQGRAFVFSGADRRLIRILDNPIPQPDTRFGSVVAGVGDVDGDGKPDLLVGAHRQDVGGNVDQGQAFVFSGADGHLIYTLTDPNGEANASFGYSLGSADVDGDNIPDFLVGAPGQSVLGRQDQGRVVVFSGATGTVLKTLHNPDSSQVGALFGSAVAGVSDLTGDGKGEILVSARLQNVGSNSRAGQAFVFNGDSGAVIYTLNTPTPQPYAWFGFAVDAGDVTGDGKTDFVVGAPLQDVSGNVNQGQVFVFDGDTLAVTTVDNPTAQEDALFGEDLAVVGNVDGLGKADILVGAPRQDVGTNKDQGQVFVVSGMTGDLILSLDNPRPQPAQRGFGNFGFSVDGAGDVNGDGTPDFLVGAREQDVIFPDQGQAWVFVSTSAPLCFGKPPTIIGTPGNDILRGTPGDDVIVALGGNDTVIGRGGNDLICGGDGNDILVGGPGTDQIDGGDGFDLCVGETAENCNP